MSLAEQPTGWIIPARVEKSLNYVIFPDRESQFLQKSVLCPKLTESELQEVFVNKKLGRIAIVEGLTIGFFLFFTQVLYVPFPQGFLLQEVK
jgi:hypothetical protein